MIDKPPLREGRDDQRRDSGSGTPAVSFWRRCMIPEPAILVIGDDHHHTRPLRAFLQRRDDVGDVLVAILTRMVNSREAAKLPFIIATKTRGCRNFDVSCQRFIVTRDSTQTEAWQSAEAAGLFLENATATATE